MGGESSPLSYADLSDRGSLNTLGFSSSALMMSLLNRDLGGGIGGTWQRRSEKIGWGAGEPSAPKVRPTTATMQERSNEGQTHPRDGTFATEPVIAGFFDPKERRIDAERVEDARAAVAADVKPRGAADLAGLSDLL